MHPPELEESTESGQYDRRSLIRFRGRTRCRGEVALDSTAAGPNAGPGVAARARGRGSSRRRGPGPAVVASAESCAGEAGSSHGIRAGIGTRAKGNGRASRADRKFAFLPAIAQEG